MGRFFNSKVNAFQDVLNSKIYIDKTGLLEYTNSVIDTTSKFICNSRPRRFGKSITADMLTAYYSRSLDTEEIFEKLEVGKTADFRKHLNQYDVIHIDIQWCIEPAGGADQVITFINKNVIEELRETYEKELCKSLYYLQIHFTVCDTVSFSVCFYFSVVREVNFSIGNLPPAILVFLYAVAVEINFTIDKSPPAILIFGYSGII